MTLVRGAFLMAIGMLFVGFMAGRSIVGPLFASGGPAQGSEIAQLATSDALTTSTPRATSPTTRGVVTPKPGASGTVTATLTAAPSVTGTPTLTPTPAATPSPVAGTVTMARYWVGTTSAKRGSLLQIGYVIDNGTGKTIHVMLGASIKRSLSLNWAAAGISDPSRDVIAIVTPGVSTHYRYFALPASLSPGNYDVAWGLRDASSGVRDALTFAPQALLIVR